MTEVFPPILGNNRNLEGFFLNIAVEPFPYLRKLPMKSKLHLILALVCVLCVTTSLSAQDVDQPEKPKAAKKAKRKKAKPSPYANLFGGAELNEAQKSQLTALAAAKKEEMSAIQTSVSELVTKENAKSIRVAMRKSVKGGMDVAEAQKAAWVEVGLSDEDQAKLVELQAQRSKIEQDIKTEIVATFSDEQKTAMATKAKKGKGKGGKKKKGKGKGKGKKKPEEQEPEEMN